MGLYTYKKIKDKLTLTSYNGNEEIVRIPSEIDGYIVSKIASMCFFDIDEMKEIHFPDDVSIENNAIVCCCNLERIYLSSATRLGNFIEDCDKAQVITSNPSISKKMKRREMTDNVIDLSIFKCITKQDGTLQLDEIVGLKKLDSVIIPNSIDDKKITSMAPRLFAGASLEELTLNDYIDTIPLECFRYSYIKRIKNTGHIKTVSNSGFYAINLTEPLYLENLETVRNYGFCYFSGEFSFGNKLKTLEKYAFKSTELTTISLATYSGVLPEGLFEDCNDLRMVILPKKTTEIPESFFDGCRNLEEVEGLKNVVRFGKSCFRGCENLITTINFKRATFIGSYAFSGCNLQRTIRLGNCELESAAFQSILGTVHVIFDDSYVRDLIPRYCFIDASIKKVTLNNNIKILCYGCFMRCGNLTSINLENIEKLEEESLKGTGIKKLTLVAIKELQQGCFSRMKDLSFVDLSASSILKLPIRAFESCSKLKEVLLPKNLEEIGYYAFGYSGIIKLNIPSSVKALGSGFVIGTKIKELIIPENVKLITSQMFSGLPRDVVIKILAMDVKFEKSAFKGLYVKNLDLSHIEMTEIVDYMFESCSIENLKLPNGIKTIGCAGFSDCDIKNLEMNTKDVTDIGYQAFYYAKIKNFEIIKTAKRYGVECYRKAYLKKEDVVLENPEYIDNDAFFSVSMKTFTIKGTPEVRRGNFECCDATKVLAEGKVYSRLKSRVYFKNSRTCSLEKIK